MKTEDIHILLVDDEPDILEILDYNLSKEGYQISTAGNGQEALQKAETLLPNLIILDVMMPEMDGFETCRKLRETPGLQDTIIIFLTALGEEHTEMAGYGVGADDYITKPIRPRVFVRKIKALLRRLTPKTDKKAIIKVDDILINRHEYQVTYAGEKLRLPRKEFELLALLAAQPQKVFKREEILKAIWGDEVIVGGRTVDVHIRKLREKIGAEKIKTVPGIGYKYAI